MADDVNGDANEQAAFKVTSRQLEWLRSASVKARQPSLSAWLRTLAITAGTPVMDAPFPDCDVLPEEPPPPKNGNGRERVDSVGFTEALIDEFGGKGEYARMLAEEFRAAEPGSHVRATILKNIQHGVEESTRIAEGRNDDDLDQLSDEQLRERLNNVVRQRCLLEPEVWGPVCQFALEAKAEKDWRSGKKKQWIDETNDLDQKLA
jgi:hypothetical protein